MAGRIHRNHLIVIAFQIAAVPTPSRAEEAASASRFVKRWFQLYPKEHVSFADELHWTRPAQNWNTRCADCHSTRLRKNYDAAADRFQTQWAEISVGCEACHGAGSAHIAWANARRDGRAISILGARTLMQAIRA